MQAGINFCAIRGKVGSLCVYGGYVVDYFLKEGDAVVCQVPNVPVVKG